MILYIELQQCKKGKYCPRYDKVPHGKLENKKFPKNGQYLPFCLVEVQQSIKSNFCIKTNNFNTNHSIYLLSATPSSFSSAGGNNVPFSFNFQPTKQSESNCILL